jgi:ATP-dependent Clp protease ATP-binding subunit ClpB
MDKLTTKFQAAIADAQSLAVGIDHQFIEPAHLLLALLNQVDGTISPLVSKAAGDTNLLRSRLSETLNHMSSVEGAAGDVHISNDLSKLLNVTDKIAQVRKDQYISSELFL